MVASPSRRIAVSRSMRSSIRAAVLVVTTALCACKTDGAATNPNGGPKKPARAPAENLFCPTQGENGVGMPPKDPGPNQLSREEVANFLAPRSKSLNECYEDRVKRGYDIEGNVGVRFMVNPQGHVQQLCLVEDATADGDLIDCLFGEIGTWQFPQRPETTEVRHRWKFRHGGD